MAELVHNEANPEELQRAMDPAMNNTVELHRTKEDPIEELVQHHGTINLDWYVPDLCNTRVGNLIKKRLQLETMEGRILFSSPALSEFFKTSNLEINLKTGRVFTYLDPPEDIGIKCQKEPFDLESLRNTTRQTRYWCNARRETRKNSKCKETSWTSRCHAQRRS